MAYSNHGPAGATHLDNFRMPLSPDLAPNLMAKAAALHRMPPAGQAGISAALLLPPLVFFVIDLLPWTAGAIWSPSLGSVLWESAITGALGAYVVAVVAIFARDPQRRIRAIAVAGAATALQLISVPWTAWSYNIFGGGLARLGYQALIVISAVLVVAAWGLARRHNQIWFVGLLVPLVLGIVLLGRSWWQSLDSGIAGITLWLQWVTTVGLGCAACWGVDALAAVSATNAAAPAAQPATVPTVAPTSSPAAQPPTESNSYAVPPSNAAYATAGPYPPVQKTNSMAIAALVSSLVLSPLGIVFGHISLSQIKRTNEDGRGLAIAGLVIGYVGTAIAATYLIIVLVAISSFKSAIDRFDSGSSYLTTTTTAAPTPTGTPSAIARVIFDSEVGDCLRRVSGTSNGDGTSSLDTLTKVSCSSSAATDRVTKRTDDINDCGKRWVRTYDYKPPIVLCLTKE